MIRIFTIFLFFISSGCAVLFGNVMPAIEKSENYSVMDLSQDGDWVKLDSKNVATTETRDAGENEISDVAYQSQSTASIISLNTSCHLDEDAKDYDLRHYTEILLLGIVEVQNRSEKSIRLDRDLALETTVVGKIDSQEMKLQTVVLKHGDCVYDMMYVSRPETFERQKSTFQKFSRSIRVN